VEVGISSDVWENPVHPYTSALLSAVPTLNPDVKRERKLITGEPPSPTNPPAGCRFHPRCPYATNVCKTEEPKMMEVASGHYVACHLT